ncbi:hypothetical protein DQ04_01441110 [Trypanosoma grayi]|uniref:hypothetical protein n=1 Tax=Trypanosoma grayi TaxID=71804 RepID=UPI0004F41030|nr:hypothetical protein DQ04_01441110 [Trypanosoma grayi]KEG12765.1 hypothetical protein DQ04_01441110 [Trypanosoma grayi]
MPLAKRRQGTSLPALVPTSQAGNAARVRSRETAENASVDTDNKVERHRYAKLLLKYVQRYQQFNSVDLFVETMMRDLAVQDGITLQTRAAAATWAMKLLCNSSHRQVMEILVGAVFPAIYCNYDERRLDYAPSALQAVVMDRALIHDNPYFSHTTYMQELSVSHTKVEDLRERLQRSLTTNIELKRLSVVILEYVRVETKRKAFRAWHALARKRRVDAMLRRNVIRRHNKTVRSSCMQAAFFRWRAAVETSRTEYLTERLHQAAFQLESAKNQFQMQCFRADKLQLNCGQVQAELRTVIEEREALRRRVEELSETLVLREKEHQERMAARMREVLTLVQGQRRMLKKAMGTRFPAEDVTAGWVDQAIEEYTLDMADSVSDGGGENSQQGHVFLLKWCNHILAQQRTKKPLHVSNFAEDFANGEAYCHIMRHVFADTQGKIPPLPRSFVERMNWMCRVVSNTQLALVLKPDDFTQHREDKMTVSLAEIFANHVDNKRTTSANKAYDFFHGMLPFQEKDSTATTIAAAAGEDCHHDDDDDVSSIPQNEEILKRKVRAWCTELQQWEEQLQHGVEHEKKLQNSSAAIAREAAYLVRERSNGQPVYVVTSKAGQSFVHLSLKSMEDLRVKFKSPSAQAWKTIVRGALKSILWKHVRLITTLFHHFGCADAHRMYEVQFWRFVEESRVMIDPLTPLAVAHIFDTVVSPQLAATLRANMKDEKSTSLEEVAQEEVDIRLVKPAQFTEMLVRMATTRHAVSLFESTDRFLSGLQMPVMKGVAPITLLFYEPEPQRVVEYFQHDLARVFFFYMKLQLSGSMRARSRSFQGCGRFTARLTHVTYLKLFADCGFLRPGDDNDNDNNDDSDDEYDDGGGYRRRVRFISSQEVLNMLQLLQGRISTIPSGEICFSLFLESFSVACPYWWPDPTVPLSRKLAAFLADMVERLRVVYARDTLVLAAPPFIALQGDEHVDLPH